MELFKVRGEYGYGDQDKDVDIVTTVSFSSFGMTTKEGKYLPRIPPGQKWTCKIEIPCNVTVTLQPLHFI